MLNRPSPYDSLKSVPALTLTSDDLTDGGKLPAVCAFASGNRSPQLSWSGGPNGTRSYAVTCYDPDAPTVSGFWHWLVTGIPASTTSLPAEAGKAGAIPGALYGPSDYGSHEYGGAAPPPGDGPHRYFFAVSALDTDDLGLDANASAAVTSFSIEAHTIARGVVMATYEL